MSSAEEIQALPRRARRKRKVRQVLAWGVHLYTGLGLVAAAAIAVLIVQGGAEAFRSAFLLMVFATLVDATDGTLARGIRVKEVLPGFDGAQLDNLIDFLTYTFLPLLLMWRAGDAVLPAGMSAWLLAPLLASAYGFCQTSAKTSDGYFLGFPSYWNLVAFYLYVLRPGVGLTLIVLIGFSLLTFVPSRYLYPSQRGRLNQLTSALGGLWAALLVCILYRLPTTESPPDDTTMLLTVVSLFFPVYYLVVSWAISLRLLRIRQAVRHHE